MIPRFRPLIGRGELSVLLQRGSADDLADFESAFALAIGARCAVAYPYGRTALRLLLESQKLRDRDVILPAYTCVVVAHAVVASGNRPVFIDCGEDGNMDLDLAERAIGARTAAIVPTSIFGHPVDLDRLDALRERHPDLLVLQDCAHSFSCEWRGRPVALAGHAAFYGCNISKIATSVFGGMVTTDDAALAAQLRRDRDRRIAPAPRAKGLRRGLYLTAAAIAFHPAMYGLTDLVRRAGLLADLENYYDARTIELPADHLVAISGLEARVGRVQIQKLAAFVAARRQYAEYYFEHLAGNAGLRFLRSPPGSSYSHVAALVTERERACARSRACGIELGRIIDYCIPAMPAYASLAAGGDWPRARRYAAHVVNLPLWGSFDEAIARRVVRAVDTALIGAAAAPALS